MKSKFVIVLLGTFVLFISPRLSFADANTSTSQNVYDNLSIEEKLDKLVTSQNQSLVDSAKDSIDTANLVVGVVALVFTGVGIFGVIGGIVFTSRIKDIEKSAKNSEKNLRTKAEGLEEIITNAKKLEEEITKRAEKSISLYEKWEAKDKELGGIEENVKKLSDPAKQEQLVELQKQIEGLKRDINRNMPSYSPSLTSYPTGSTGPSGPSVYPGSVSTTTTLPYYSSPSSSFSSSPSPSASPLDEAE